MSSSQKGGGRLQNKRAKIIFVALIQVAVTVGLLFVLSKTIDFRAVLSSLASVEPHWLILAVCTFCVQQFSAAFRWRLLTARLGGRTLKLSFYAFWQGVSVLLLQILPSTLGGDLVRMGSGARTAGLGLGAGVVVVDRVIGMATLCLLVLVGSGLFSHLFIQQPALLLPLLMAVAGIFACVFVVLIAKFFHGRRFTLHLDKLGNALRLSVKSESAIPVWGISLLIHLLSVIVVFCLLQATHAPSPEWLALSFLVSAAFLVSALPLSLGGWGVREGAFVVGLGLVGLSDEIALTVSVLFGLSLTLSGLLLLLLALVFQGKYLLRREFIT